MILHQKLLIFEEFKEAYILFMNCTPIELQIKNNYVLFTSWWLSKMNDFTLWSNSIFILLGK